MSEEVEFLICGNCESPCYSFEIDKKDRVLSAFCSVCANDDPKDFTIPEAEDAEDMG